MLYPTELRDHEGASMRMRGAAQGVLHFLAIRPVVKIVKHSLRVQPD